MTPPLATLELDWLLTVPTTSPADLSTSVAEDSDLPTTFGTVAPELTVIVTDCWGASWVPAAGLWERTLPVATLELGAVSTSTEKPAFWSSVVAADWESPTTFGTVVAFGPVPT